jgi:nicotinamidase-related amidase
MDVGTLVFTGLATSQCVETTARDASDRGFRVVHVEDAQADYDEISHTSSLYSSQGVCGGIIVTTEEFMLDGPPAG